MSYHDIMLPSGDPRCIHTLSSYKSKRRLETFKEAKDNTCIYCFILGTGLALLAMVWRITIACAVWLRACRSIILIFWNKCEEFVKSVTWLNCVLVKRLKFPTTAGRFLFPVQEIKRPPASQGFPQWRLLTSHTVLISVLKLMFLDRRTFLPPRYISITFSTHPPAVSSKASYILTSSTLRAAELRKFAPVWNTRWIPRTAGRDFVTGAPFSATACHQTHMWLRACI